MQRLIIFTYDYPSNNGGIARLCGEIRKQCERTGLPVLVITAAAGAEAADTIRVRGRRGVQDWRMLRTLRRHLRAGDVVLTGTYHPDGALALLAGAPTYMLAHGAEVMARGHGLARWALNAYRRYVLRRARRVITNSHYTARLVSRCSPKARITPLPLGVDTEYFYPTMPKPSDGRLHLLSISRLQDFKAQDFVLRTLAHLPPSYREKIRLSIGGKGDYKPTLERMVRELRLQEQVTFLGFIPDDRLRDVYSAHDVFILTTREARAINQVEGFGLVFTEAQACGTPCIGSRSGGIPDAVCEGQGGWLIREDDEAALAALLCHLADNPAEVEEQGRRGLQRMRDVGSWQHYFERLTKLLQ